jgi:hypothetical protein
LSSDAIEGFLYIPTVKVCAVAQEHLVLLLVQKQAEKYSKINENFDECRGSR